MRTRLSLRLVTLTLLAALSAAPALAQAAKPREPRGLAGAGLTQAKVDAAVERAKQFVLAQLEAAWSEEAGEAPPQEPLLALLTLSHTDAFQKDRKLRARAIEGLYKAEIGSTYPTAIVILTLEHLGGRAHAERIADAAQVLVDGQVEPEGGWTYVRPRDEAAPPFPVRAVPAEGALAVIEVTGGLPLSGSAAAKRLARGPAFEAGDRDLSNTQFALLGLHSASTSGVEVGADPWKKAVGFFAEGQNPDGGWGYTPKDGSSYGSMTCAGVASLSLALHHTGAKDPAADPRVKQGLAWLGKHFTLEKNPEPASAEGKHEWHYYFLYGLERVGALLSTPFIGEHEWYPEGAAYLLKNQRAEGSWLAPEHAENEVEALKDTCFALLFLTRATTPIASPRGGAGTLRTALAAPIAPPKQERALLFVLDASGSMNDKIGGKTKWEVVRDASKKLVATLPDDAIVGLRVYGHNQLDVAEVVSAKESELLLPIARLDRAAFNKIVDGLVPVGRTPIAESLKRCGGDLSDAPPCRVLLLSDGAETGRGDPVAAATELAKNPKCLGIDCLGFDLASEPKARGQLQEIARIGRGRYTESEDPEVLARAGSRSAAEYSLLDPAGKEILRGMLGDARPLPEGEYRLRVMIGDRPHEAAVWINTGVETVATVRPERAKR